MGFNRGQAICMWEMHTRFWLRVSIIIRYLWFCYLKHTEVYLKIKCLLGFLKSCEKFLTANCLGMMVWGTWELKSHLYVALSVYFCYLYIRSWNCGAITIFIQHSRATGGMYTCHIGRLVDRVQTSQLHRLPLPTTKTFMLVFFFAYICRSFHLVIILWNTLMR